MKNNQCEISFYHLSKQPVTKALPKLLEKIYQSGLKSLVICNSDSEMTALNEVIWTFASKSFLPHSSIKEPFPELQPILLTTSSHNINHSDVIIILSGIIPENINEFKRCLDMFYGSKGDETVTQAQNRHATYKENGYTLAYWTQIDDGSWVSS